MLSGLSWRFCTSRQFDRQHYRLFPVDFDLGPITALNSTYHLQTVYPYPLLNMFSALPVINDYGPFWSKRYQAVTGFSAGGTMPIANLQNYKMLSFLGARYLMVLSPQSASSYRTGEALFQAGARSALKAFSPVEVTANGIMIFENPNALPRFRFIRRLSAAQSLEDALSLMNRSDFNPGEEAIVEGIKRQPANVVGKYPEGKNRGDAPAMGSRNIRTAVFSWWQIHFSRAGPQPWIVNLRLSMPFTGASEAS